MLNFASADKLKHLICVPSLLSAQASLFGTLFTQLQSTLRFYQHVLLRAPGVRPLAVTEPAGTDSLEKLAAEHAQAAKGSNMAKTANEGTFGRPASQRPPQKKQLDKSEGDTSNPSICR